MSKYEFQPRDLRHVGRTITNKQMARRRVNAKYEIKRNKKKAYEREAAEKKKTAERFGNYRTSTETFHFEIGRAKNVVANFMQRTGILLELDGIHGRIERREQKVLLVVEELYPMNGRSWLNLTENWGHRPALNKVKLRKICSKLSVPRWNDMTAQEMRAVLFLLAWMDGIDPEKAWFRDWKDDQGDVQGSV
jgi:hypothetical protein